MNCKLRYDLALASQDAIDIQRSTYSVATKICGLLSTTTLKEGHIHCKHVLKLMGRVWATNLPWLTSQLFALTGKIAYKIKNTRSYKIKNTKSYKIKNTRSYNIKNLTTWESEGYRTKCPSSVKHIVPVSGLVCT